ncbi:hypothetical protein MSIMFB_01491 [Mycobacterium simulans]|uniref:DUF4345 domain-containing protein n=1 Tax=Mycobacterium simulans TaxID=627089 RepID=A0A7Z7IKQ7_9MYCO|nr:DUF4345 domain-containing protein [Mycobacterium simulans]SOJ53993.1 hypothetical protein MSIMFB_01491 [Mycobacterium simulans]
MTITVLVAFAVGFFGLAIWALATPAKFVEGFGILLPKPESRSEVRAVYGGFGLAFAGVLTFAALQSSSGPGSLRAGIMLTLGVAMAGMVVGRIISAVADGGTPFYPNWAYAIAEGGAATALLLTAQG